MADAAMAPPGRLQRPAQRQRRQRSRSTRGPRSRRCSARRSSGSTARTRSPAARVHLRHQSARDDLRQDRPLAASARAHRRRSICPRRRRRRASRPSLDLQGAGRAGDVSGRSGRGGRRRHRRARASTRRGWSACSYEALPHFATDEQAMAADAPVVFPGGNTRQGATRGDRRSRRPASAQAAHIVEATYSTHVITHVCLETHGCVCEWEGDKLTAWVSTQGVHQARAAVRARRSRFRRRTSA